MMALDRLRANGIVRMPAFQYENALNAQRFLEHCPRRFNGHVKKDGVPFTLDSPTCCWGMEDVIAIPHLLEFALWYTDLAEEYLGEPPLMYSVNAFATRHDNRPTDPYIQEFHRDHDDRKFLALFIYLTPVLNYENGPHEFKVGTHQRSPMISEADTFTLYGDAGTTFLADTYGLHRGVRPGPHAHPSYRMIAWVRWGVSEPPKSYHWDKLSPVPAKMLGDAYPQNPRLQKSIRLVCR